MLITDVEQGIIDRLKAKITLFAVEAFPDNPDAYNLAHVNGALLVRYGGTNYGKPVHMGPVIQTGETLFEVNIIVRHLRTHTGAYSAIDQVKAALIGYVPKDGCTRLTAVRDEFIEQSSGLWQYAVTFRTKLDTVEVPDSVADINLEKIVASYTLKPGDDVADATDEIDTRE
jgi:hypothetical protein